MLNYNKFMEGMEHNISIIDDNWILKTPKKIQQINRGDKKFPPGNPTELTLIRFDKHINTMKHFPEIFPKVKRLSKFRAAIERCDMDKVTEELNYILNVVPLNSPKTININNLLRNLYYDFDNALGILNEYGKKENDVICQKWFNFIILLKKTKLENYLKQHFIDLHSENIGIDKKGNIKLIDF